MNRIVIIGLGLIGGSLAAACQRFFPGAKIVGVTRNPRALAFAKRKGWIDEGYRRLEDAFKNVGAGLVPALSLTGRTQGPPLHLIILCTPVDTLKNFLLRLDRIAPAGTVVTDTGSVKGSIVRWADRQRWKRIQFVGSHPMAGSHRRGIDAVDPALFRQALTLVTPARRTPSSALQTVNRFWKKISGRVISLSPEQHDRFTAEVSHLPHFLASWLVASVSPEAIRFATTGFLDTTRVAEGSPEIWEPIFRENRRELLRALEKFEATLRRAKRILQRKEISKLRRALQQVQRRRSRLE